MRVILDADVIAYMSSAGAEEHDGVFGEDDHVSHLQDAIRRSDDMVGSWTDTAMDGAVEERVLALAFSGRSSDNFRRRVHPKYKHNRSGEKPEHYTEVIEHLRATYDSLSESELEGDDIIGMMMGEGWVGVSTDKDMRTVPGKFVHIRYDGSVDRYDTTLEMGNHFWMWQTLVGDTVDGYLGCPGCGKKGAETVLPYPGATLSTLWMAVLQRYEEAWRKPKMRAKFITGSAYDEALMNARAARILRTGDYELNEDGYEEVHLWTP